MSCFPYLEQRAAWGGITRRFYLKLLMWQRLISQAAFEGDALPSFITCTSLSLVISDTKPQSWNNLYTRSTSKRRLQSKQGHVFNFPLIIFLSISHEHQKASLTLCMRNNNPNFILLCHYEYVSFNHPSVRCSFDTVHFYCIQLIKVE